MKLHVPAAAALLASLSACAPVQAHKDYSKFMAEQPRSILVVPVVNRSNYVDAPSYFLSTVSIPVAERGYYVFPVNMVKRVLEDDGLSDADLVHHADPAKLAALFGADAVLYVSIDRWDSKYFLLQTNVTVELSYVLRTRSGAEVWGSHQTQVFASGGGNLLESLVNAAVAKAAPQYMPLARKANGVAFAYPGEGFPAGPYHPQFGQDLPAAVAPAAAPADGKPAGEAPATAAAPAPPAPQP